MSKEHSVKLLVFLIFLGSISVTFAGGFHSYPMTGNELAKEFFSQVQAALESENKESNGCKLRYPIEKALEAEVKTATLEKIVDARSLVYNPHEIDFIITLSRDIDEGYSGLSIHIELENESCNFFDVHYLIHLEG